MATIRTSSGDDISLAASAKKFAAKATHMEITLDNSYSSKVYTSGSPISGNVKIVTKRDVHFDSVQVLLLGSSRTRVDGISVPQEITHTFLKMTMPIPESSYPVPRLLEAGREYTVPFNFVIPQYLTVNACNHHMFNPHIGDQHVLLPPSMGRWEKSDMSPAMAHVEYAIKARLFREAGGDNPSKLSEAIQRLNVLPASVEEPPLNVTKNDVLYKMSKTKSVRKNLISAKQGRITAEAVQPGAVFLRSDGRTASSTTVPISLTFEPASADVVVPKITGVTGKLEADTFFSSATIPSLPNLGNWNQQFSERRGYFSSTTSLPSIDEGNVRWSRQIVPSARRDSGYASEFNDDDNASEPDSLTSGRRNTGSQSRSANKAKPRSGSPLLHTATLQLPIRLPTDKKTFIPTFHSCILSRVYVLHLSVAVSTGSARTTLNLAVPLQIAVASDAPGSLDAGLPTFESVLQQSAAAEADEHLRPRTIGVPQQDYMQTSVLPGYGV